jgi:hypothetical protein
MVCLAQAMHQSCDKISTITKRTETRFRMTHVTLEYHRVCPKLFLGLITTEYHRVCPKCFLSLRYVWRKPSTYVASKRTEMRFYMTHVM